MPHALVIAIDGLRASALGAYGNTWYDTPALDALAAQSVVHDWMWCPSTDLGEFYAGLWQGHPPLVRRLADAGVSATLTTDDPALTDARASDFAEVCRFEMAAEDLASSIADTSLARLFALAAQQLQTAGESILQHSQTPSSCLWWLHARGFYGAWDAPLDVRQSLLDEEDPAAPTFVTPPPLARTADHDELLVCRVAYAAQAMVLDQCLGALMDAIADSALDEDTLVALVGCRGYALGEHRALGPHGLYSETLHVPCLIRTPGAQAPPPRSANFSQPSDLVATLAAWFGLESPAAPSRDFVVASSCDGERAIRTPAWMLRQPPQQDSNAQAPVAELYVKPDDRWEANEVASRVPEVAARLLAALDKVQSGADSFPLDEDLLIPAH
jgi:arylsulfatase A-like enzyme